MRLDLSQVTIQVSKNTSRKARSYMQAYANKYGGSHVFIEKFVQIRKYHRNMLDQETAYLERRMAMIKKHDREVMEERLSLHQETKEGEI